MTDRYDDLLKKARAAHESGGARDAQGWEALAKRVHADRAPNGISVARRWAPAALGVLALGWWLFPQGPADIAHAPPPMPQERLAYQQGDRVETHSHEEAFVAFGATHVVAGRNTQLSLGEWKSEHMEITLHRGHLSVDVTLERPGARFEVIVAGHRVRVIGTTFSVDFTESTGLAVLVQHGEVSITDREGVITRVRRGEAFHKGPTPNAGSTAGVPAPAPPAVEPPPSPKRKEPRRTRAREGERASAEKVEEPRDGVREILI